MDESRGLGSADKSYGTASPSQTGGEAEDADFTVEDVVEKFKKKWAHWNFLQLVGLAYMADGGEVMVLALVTPTLECQWGLSPNEVAAITMAVFGVMTATSCLWGLFADKSGRKLALILVALIVGSSGLFSAAANSFIVFVILRSLTGFGLGGLHVANTLYSEFAPSRLRGKGVLMLCAFWGMSSLLLAGVAIPLLPVSSNGWRWLLVVSSVPIFVFLILSPLVPESARHYLARKKPAKARKALEKAAKGHGVSLPRGQLVAEGQVGQKGFLFWLKLFAPEFRLTTAIVSSLWWSCAFVYYGMVFLTTEIFTTTDLVVTQGNQSHSCGLGTSELLSIFWTCTAEVIGIVAGTLIVERVNRRPLFFALMMISGLSFLVMAFVLHYSGPLISSLFLARGTSITAYQFLYIYTAEVYPTEFRATSIGWGCLMARAAAILAPWVSKVAGSLDLRIPIGLYSGVSLAAALAAFLLPFETRGKTLKDGAG